MSTRLILGIILLSITNLCIAQESSEPFKKANTIIIKSDFSGEEAFMKWGKHLVQNGYSFSNNDKTFLTLKTEPRNTSKYNADFIFISSISDDGLITIKIKWRIKSSLLAGTDETDYYDWEYSKGKNNVQGIIYNDLLPTIKSFGSFEIDILNNKIV